MKILLISGHGAGDCGACGNGFQEADLTREVVNKVAEKLRTFCQVDIYNQLRNAYKDVNAGKLPVIFSNYDYVFEVHFNAFNKTARGTEIFVTREEPQTTVEEAIMNKLSAYFSVRGVKRKNFDVIAKARRSGVSSALLETCFIDNSEDMNIYVNNKDGICEAIAEGIKEGFGLVQTMPQTITEQKPAQTTKSIVDLANEVIAGKHGTGEARKQALGSLYNEVQSKVNEILGVKKTITTKKSVDTIAREVIEGKWGNGQDRKNRITKAGYNYNEVQKRVNQLMR